MRMIPFRRRVGAALSALVGGLAILLGGAVAPARASLDITVGNPGMEHFDSDGVVQLDFGMTDNNGQPVGNLRPENLQVYEDGVLAKILDFRGVGQGQIGRASCRERVYI